MKFSMKKVTVLLADGFEEIEPESSGDQCVRCAGPNDVT